MNSEKRTFKIIAFVLFVMFAFVSCWSTTQSLFLTLENSQIPKLIFWLVVVGLFILTAFCTKLALDSLNTNDYIEHRRLKFCIGLAGFIVLWLLFSMPTNSHTFFYKQMAKRTAEFELKYLENELINVTDTIQFLSKHQTEWDKYESSVLMALDQLKQEIKDPNKKGFAEIAESKLAHIEDLLNLKTGTIERRYPKNLSLAQLNLVCEYYDNVVKEHLNILENQHLVKVRQELVSFKDKKKSVGLILKDIKKCQIELNSEIDKEESLAKSRKVIESSYAILETTFPLKENNDKKDNKEPVYKSDRLIKVTKVWEDYLAHKFRNTDYTLWYWILLSVIVDIAAFAFFDIATKKDDFDL